MGSRKPPTGPHPPRPTRRSSLVVRYRGTRPPAAKPVRNRRCPATVMPHRGSRLSRAGVGPATTAGPSERPASSCCGDEPGRLRCGRDTRSRGRAPRGRVPPAALSAKHQLLDRQEDRCPDVPPGCSPRPSRWPRSRSAPAPRRLRRRPRRRRQLRRGRLPGHGRQRSPSTSGPRRSSRCRPTATEMLFAIGAGKQVTAVDDQSNYPAGRAEERPVRLPAQRRGDRRQEPRPGGALQRHQQDRRPAHHAEDPGATSPRRRPPSTTRTGSSPTWARSPATRPRRPTSTARMKDDIAKLAKDLPQRSTKLTYYHELDPELYSATSKTFIGSLYALAGLENIADAVGRRRQATAATRSSPRRSSSRPTRTSSSWPTPSAASRAPTRSRPAAAGPASPRSRTTRSSRSTTTSPRAGARAWSTCSAPIVDAVAKVPA